VDEVVRCVCAEHSPHWSCEEYCKTMCVFERFPLKLDYLWEVYERSLEIRSAGFDVWTVISPERFAFWMRYKFKVPEGRWAELMEEIEALHEIVREHERKKGGVAFTEDDLNSLIELDQGDG